MNAVVKLHAVTKHFQRLAHYRSGLKSLLVQPASIWGSSRHESFLSLDNVTLEVRKGEVLGVVGRNGEGKSTLLSLIGGILKPTSGHISVRGRICLLLEFGAGFALDLTGRENIILNGVLFGLRRYKIEEQMEDIIEFSGLSEFIEQPLKTFSTGMQMRLGFAIAVHAQPDILLVDEALAVGDAEFQEKCLERIEKLRNQGVTIIFFSHDLEMLEAMCDRATWIDHGRLIVLGEAKEVIQRYRSEVGHGRPAVLEHSSLLQQSEAGT